MSSATALITVDELREVLAGPQAQRPALVDVRWQLGSDSGHREYVAGHLPGAVWLDLDTDLSGPVRPDGRGGRHPMPDAASFQAAMRSAGVSSGRPVVCYDAGSSLSASRAWWLLRYFGKDDVRVLDGGLAAWTAAGLPVESGAAQPRTPGDVIAIPGSRRLADADQAQQYAVQSVLLDARPADRFRGENETIDPVAGHIPGARSAPALANLRADGRFLPPEELAARFAAVGLRAGGGVGGGVGAGAGGDGGDDLGGIGDDVAVYCGSGVQAAHEALALQVAGITDDAAVYVGSWSDWISDPSRPVELG